MYQVVNKDKLYRKFTDFRIYYTLFLFKCSKNDTEFYIRISTYLVYFHKFLIDSLILDLVLFTFLTNSLYLVINFSFSKHN